MYWTNLKNGDLIIALITKEKYNTGDIGRIEMSNGDKYRVRFENQSKQYVGKLRRAHFSRYEGDRIYYDRYQNVFSPHNYKNMQYMKPDKMTFNEMKNELDTIWKDYDEYNDSPFIDMVELFANDDFYHLHYVAKEYLEYINWINE